MNQTIDVVEWLQERAFRMYGPTMEAAHTKTKEWLWADEITRLRAELAAALAECERLNKSRNQWGKKYNDCLGKLRLAVMSDSDECKELTAQNNNLRADLAAVTAERERLREALERIDGMATTICMRADAGYGMTVETVMPIYETARAALEGVTEKEGEGNE